MSFFCRLLFALYFLLILYSILILSKGPIFTVCFSSISILFYFFSVISFDRIPYLLLGSAKNWLRAKIN